MSLTAVLSSALTGLSVAQNALGVTAHNIANANTPGYVRKLPNQEAVVVDGQGLGARSLATTRAVDEMLDAEFRKQSARLGRSEVLADVQDRIQQRLFGGPGDNAQGLSKHLSDLATRLEALANAPQVSASRLAFVDAAQDLGRQLAANAADIQSLRQEVDRQVKAVVDKVNADIEALAAVNGQLTRSIPTPELLDRRDSLLRDLAGQMEISVFRHDNESVAVYTAGGDALLEYAPRILAYSPSANVVHDGVFGEIALYDPRQIDPATGLPQTGETGRVLVSSGVRAVLTPELEADATADSDQTIVSPFTAGRLQGLIEARDQVLPQLADQLRELASVARFALDAAHNAGVPYPPPATLTGSREDFSAFAASSPSGTAYLAVINTTDGSTQATVAIDLAAASSIADIVTQINAATPLLAASIDGDGRLVVASTDPDHGIALDEGDSSVTVTDTAGHARDYGFAHYAGLNDLFAPSGTDPTDLAVRADVVADVSLLTAVRLDVDTGPPLTSTAGGSGDNRGAAALAAALDTSFATIARGRLPAGQATLAGYAADIVAAGAVAAAQAQGLSESDQAVVDDLTYRQGAASGVNLDEEMARLVTYQQAYAVSARLLAITNELFDDLLAIKR